MRRAIAASTGAPRPEDSGGRLLMYDLAALGLVVACFVFIAALIYLLDRV